MILPCNNIAPDGMILSLSASAICCIAENTVRDIYGFAKPKAETGAFATGAPMQKPFFALSFGFLVLILLMQHGLTNAPLLAH